MLRVDLERSGQLFRSQAIPRILSGAQLPHNATYFRLRSNLIRVGLIGAENHYSDSMVLNFHDLRLDMVMKPKVRRLAILLENAGPLGLRALARISNMSLQSVHRAARLLKSSGLIESSPNQGRGMLELASEAVVRSDPIDEIPSSEYKAFFVDVTKGLKSKCRAAVLLDDFGITPSRQLANIFLLVNAGLEKPLGQLANLLRGLERDIKFRHGVQLHFTIANEIHMMSFLNAKRGVWPTVFMRAAHGLVFIGNLKHDGRSLFEAVQRVLTYSPEKIDKLVKSGTLVKQDEGLAFSDLGMRRYVRLTRIPTLEQVNSTVSALL